MALVAMALGAAGPAWSVEQARYAVEVADGAFELRRYEPRVVAETRVTGDFEDVGNVAFRRLAGYIGGANRAKTSIAMTAPVTQEAGERIAMTAPVTQQSDGESYRIAFVMPASYTLDRLPEPNDASIALREEPARGVAAIRYRGTWSQARYERHLGELRAWIAAQGLVPTGAPPVWARYDPPFMPWFLRRNEVLIEVESAPR